jgi:hypothetical protein
LLALKWSLRLLPPETGNQPTANKSIANVIQSSFIFRELYLTMLHAKFVCYWSFFFPWKSLSNAPQPLFMPTAVKLMLAVVGIKMPSAPQRITNKV